MASKQNCWEFMKCGREPGGVNAERFGTCPAAFDILASGTNGGVNGGRICWSIAGTLCGQDVEGTFAKRRYDCMSCPFYKKTLLEEGEHFIALRRGCIFKPPPKE